MLAKAIGRQADSQDYFKTPTDAMFIELYATQVYQSDVNFLIRFDKALHKCESCAQGEREELLSKSKQS